MNRLLIIGCGGHAKVILDCVLALEKYSKISFMTQDANIENFIGYPALSEKDVSMKYILDNFDEAVVAIGNNDIRLNKSVSLANHGVKLATLLHPRSVISRFAQIGIGSVVLANAVVNPFASVGNGCIINTGAIVEHDCIIKDGVHVSPGVTMGGTVSIGEKSWICIGSNIVNNIQIGKNVVVGGGSMVLQDIPDNVMVAGVPATIKKHI